MAQFPPPSRYQPGYPRPGVVTASAVLAFVIGGFGIVVSLLGFTALSSAGGGYAAILIVLIVVYAVFLWGGSQALSGKDGRIVVVAAGVAILMNVVSMIVYATASGILGLVIPILIVLFMRQPASRQFFRSQGRPTF